MSLLIASGTAGEILRVAYTAMIASVAVSAVFAVGVLGIARASEARRVGRRIAASAYTVFAVGAGLLCAAAFVYAVVLVGRKS